MSSQAIDFKTERKLSDTHGLKAEQNARRFEKALRNLTSWDTVEEITMKFFEDPNDVLNYLKAVEIFRSYLAQSWRILTNCFAIRP